jgi:hypothetical protein
MTVLRPRSRMISVRLSEEEYLTLRRLCSVTGARSISDLTRDAVQVLLRGANGDSFLGTYKDELRTQIQNLHKKVEQLTADMSSHRAETKNSSQLHNSYVIRREP